MKLKFKNSLPRQYSDEETSSFELDTDVIRVCGSLNPSRLSSNILILGGVLLSDTPLA